MVRYHEFGVFLDVAFQFVVECSEVVDMVFDSDIPGDSKIHKFKEKGCSGYAAGIAMMLTEGDKSFPSRSTG